MKKLKSLALLCLILLLATALLAGCGKNTPDTNNGITEVPAEGSYDYVNPDETKAEPDAGIVIDGILDEGAYQDNNWLYLHNEDGGNKVDIAMTSHYGEKGMYFVYDVTESVPIYVNLARPSYMNSCIEMYLAPSYVTSVQANSVFEIDLLPTGDMIFKKSNGRYGYTTVTTTNDKMAVLGATTKGGEVNTPECYGYCLELFIPWEYMQWLDMDVDSMKNGFVYINPAHITSNNLSGTNVDLDRYWYFYAQQNGAQFTDVAQYFRFDGKGVQGGVPVVLQSGEHYTISGAPSVIPGMTTVVQIKPDDGYALTSILVNGKEQIQNADFNEDGSVNLTVRSSIDGVKVSAKAEAVSAGNKTLSGKVILNNINKDTFSGMIVTYMGPKGEKPLQIDADGNFQLKDMEQGYYVLKAEKEGYTSVSRSICLNRDSYTELVLEYNYFQVVGGSCWILDEQNNGVLYKQGGVGQVLSNASYNDFTFRANLKYDPKLAKMGEGDLFYQQRSGIRIQFSNGKTWHIDMLKEKDEYVLQYAKFSGENSVTGWHALHKLNADQISRYSSKDGIALKVMRQGNYAAIWLDNELIKIEVLDKQYDSCTAQLGFESWITNRDVMEFPFSIQSHSTVDVKNSPFLVHAKSWNISGQYSGTVTREPLKDRAWLDSVINSNDVTTVAKDHSPDTKDYSLAYIFKFSNGEQVRIRLNHTDGDGIYRIQTMAGSTLVPAWKNAYAFTDEETARVKGDGIEYRIRILGTTAYVYLDGKEVCTFDLSTVIATGKPSGIEKATAKVSFALDGNMNKTTVLPFKLQDTTKTAVIDIDETANGKITASKESYGFGETVKLTVSGDAGYYYTDLRVNGQKVDVKWDGTYSFKAAEHVYRITGSFATGKFREDKSTCWNVLKQNQNILYMNSHKTGNSGWLCATINANEISATLRDLTPKAKDFAMVYHFGIGGEALQLALKNSGSKYTVQVMDGSTLAAAGEVAYTLSVAEEKLLKGDGIAWRVTINGTAAEVYLDNSKVATMDLGSSVQDADVRVKIRMDGNLNQAVEIPYELINTKTQVMVNVAEMTNGTVSTDKLDYMIGDTVTLIVAPDAGYSQKIFVNGEALLLDWNTNTYSFVATEHVYNITGSFEPSLVYAPSDALRWDTANGAHGVLMTRYPNNNDSWWMDIKGEYKSFAVTAKNHLPQEDSIDGNGKTGYAMVLGVTMDNGSRYAFRFVNNPYNGAGRYEYTRFGSGGSVTGWGGWCALEDKVPGASDKINGDGIEFKVTRINGSTLQVTLDGTVLDTYTMAGVSGANKVTAVSIYHYGNKSEEVQIPFAVEVPVYAPAVQLNIAQMTNGVVTPEQDYYQVGETVNLMIAPDAGFSQKLYINGEPLLLDWKTNTYSFTATEEVYNITGSFEPSLVYAPSDEIRWDTKNSAHGVLSTYYPNNKDSWWMDIKGEYQSFALTAKNYLPQADSIEGNGNTGFSVVLSMTMDNGNRYAFRIINNPYNDAGRYEYTRYGASGSVTGWSGWCVLDEKLPGASEKINGDGVEFKVTRINDTQFQVTLDGTVLDTYTMSGVTGANKVTAVSIYHYGNKGQKIELPFQVEKPAQEEQGPAVQLNIATMSNGTITPGQPEYHVGDVVTLLVSPNAGYSQKLYINDLPLLPGWKTNSYSFVATEEVYNITGSFVPSLSYAPYDANRWDTGSGAHGVLKTYYPKDTNSWWIDIKGEYQSFAVKAKNYLPQADSIEGNGKIGYAITVGFTLDNGNRYAFRFINNPYNGAGRYEYTRFGASGSVTGWGGWCVLDEKVPGASNKINGDGIEFKVTRINDTQFQITLDGTVLDTYTMAGVTGANKVTAVSIYHYGNQGQIVEIPYELS